MKKSFLIPLCLILSISLSGFSFVTHPESAEVLQKSLELKQLKRILEKDAEGNFLPLQLVSNEFVDKKARLYREGQRIKIYTTEQATELDSKRKFFTIENLKIKQKKSILKLLYDEKEVKIKLWKDENEDQWLFRSIFIKSGKGNYYLDIEMKK